MLTDVLTRLRWQRRRLLAGALVIALAALTAVVVEGAVSDAQRREAAYGRSRAVLVATHDLTAGHTLVPADLAVARWPVGLVPPGALDPEPIAVAGRTVAAEVLAGEPLVARRIAPGGLSAVAGRVPDGRRGLLVPSGPGLPPLEVGDRVDLVAADGVFDPLDPLGAAEPEAVVVARAAPVVAVDDRGATVAVSLAEVPATVLALAGHAVVVALTGW